MIPQASLNFVFDVMFPIAILVATILLVVVLVIVILERREVLKSRRETQQIKKDFPWLFEERSKK